MVLEYICECLITSLQYMLHTADSTGDHSGSWSRGVGSDSCNGTTPEGCAQSSGHTAVDEDTDSNGDDHTEQDEEEDGETNS